MLYFGHELFEKQIVDFVKCRWKNLVQNIELRTRIEIE